MCSSDADSLFTKSGRLPFKYSVRELHQEVAVTVHRLLPVALGVASTPVHEACLGAAERTVSFCLLPLLPRIRQAPICFVTLRSMNYEL